MNSDDDRLLDVLQNIEVGLKTQYELDPDLTDSLCVFALDNAKIAVKQQHGFARNERVSTHESIQAIVAWCVAVGVERIGKINDLTLKEYLAGIDKVRNSVARHAGDGNRGYYHFIKAFLP